MMPQLLLRISKKLIDGFKANVSLNVLLNVPLKGSDKSSDKGSDKGSDKKWYFRLGIFR